MLKAVRRSEEIASGDYAIEGNFSSFKAASASVHLL